MDHNEDSIYEQLAKAREAARQAAQAITSEVYQNCADEIQNSKNDRFTGPVRSIAVQKRQIVGVLYSISAGVEGEIFPLYLGRNTIGSALNADVSLREQSVEKLHAVINIDKKVGSDGEYHTIVYISDNHSSSGTIVDGLQISAERKSCRQGSILGFGLNYLLQIFIFDLGQQLTVARSFKRLSRPDSQKKSAGSIDPYRAPKYKREETTENPEVFSEGPNEVRSKAEQRVAIVDPYSSPKKQGGDHYTNKTIIV